MVKRKSPEIKLGLKHMIVIGVIVAILLIVGIFALTGIRSVPAGHKCVAVAGPTSIGTQYDEGIVYVGPFVDTHNLPLERGKDGWNTYREIVELSE